jgi:hypothetical protein
LTDKDDDLMTKAVVPGPTYAEMRDPLLLPPTLREAANRARQDELSPLNLFNINWKNTGDRVEKLVLPKELTGVPANIVVLSGRTFPSGSMKVGPAYVTLAEAEATAALRPGDKTVQFRHRHSLCQPAQGLPRRSRHAGQHERRAL